MCVWDSEHLRTLGIEGDLLKLSILDVIRHLAYYINPPHATTVISARQTRVTDLRGVLKSGTTGDVTMTSHSVRGRAMT